MKKTFGNALVTMGKPKLVKGGEVNQNLKGWIFVLVQFGLFAGIVMTPSGTDWKSPISLLPVSYLAFAAAVVALWQLGKARTANPVPKANAELIVSGMYKYVRHPIYGLLLVGFGVIALQSQNWQAVRFYVSLQILFYLKSNFEEQLLRMKFPGYEEYAKTRGRFFPRVLSN